MLFAPRTIKRRSIHSGRLERWLGKEKIEQLSNNFLHGGGPGNAWYGHPVNLTDVPGSVWICGDGDFVGSFDRGFLASAADSLADHLRRLWSAAGKPIYIPEQQLGAGFADVADAIERMRTGYRQYLAGGNIVKTAGISNGRALTFWGVGSLPVAGAAGSAAPGGRAPVSTTTGAMWFNNPSSGTLHLTGADMSSTEINNAVMVYDRIFDVAKTMASTATESVTGVPTRYQSSTPTADDYAGGNFLFPEIRTTLGSGAHDWTVCLYRDDAGNDAQTLPSVSGINGGLAPSFEFNTGDQWFCPLATGDVGIMDLNQMQCSASVTGAINFVIGHPLGVMTFPVISSIIPFDWLTVRSLGPRVFNDACVALFSLPKPNSSDPTFSGTIEVVNAP